ncbi:FAD-dependent oxidoreductase [Microbispora sp. NPDC049633]|uniref:FAD-dependent oxidoreductase n=1 Tax=Microbispora sp. NPDC049633 TaxID=3154355 RepID=UPI0034183914
MFAGTGVEVVIAKVTGVDVGRRTVTVAGANGTAELTYDTLVYALGSGWNAQGVPGAAEHAYEIAGRAGALRLRERLSRLTEGQAVVVVGGGLTGIEAAAEIAEARPDLDVALAARDGLGDRLSPVDGTGQIVVDGTMRSVSHPDVYAIGDAAMVMGPGNKPLRMSCASGTPTAWQAADAIAARLTGGPLPNASIRYFNQCMSLGRKEGLIQYVTADDRAVRAVLTGRLAAVYKELICKSAAWGVANPTPGLPARRRPVTRQRGVAGPAVKEPA